MFERFESRRIIEGTLTAVTAIHIGAAEDVFEPGGCKNPFFRNAAGLPVIPGSSLKGAMRSFLEQILAGESGWKAIQADLHCQKKICNEEEPCADPEKDQKLKILLESKKRESSREIAEYLFGNPGNPEGKLCMACRLFGSPYSAAKLNIRDAGVLEDSFQKGFEIRSGVAINRNLGTSEDGKKFEEEVVPAGTAFLFRAVLENADDAEWEAVRIILRAMEKEMIPIGGNRSRGLGVMKLEDATYQHIDRNNLADYLTGKEEDVPALQLLGTDETTEVRKCSEN